MHCVSKPVYWAFPIKRYWQKEKYGLRHVCICKAESVRTRIKLIYIFSTGVLNMKVCIIWFFSIRTGKDVNTVMTSKVMEELISYKIMLLSNKLPPPCLLHLLSSKYFLASFFLLISTRRQSALMRAWYCKFCKFFSISHRGLHKHWRRAWLSHGGHKELGAFERQITGKQKSLWVDVRVT